MTTEKNSLQIEAQRLLNLQIALLEDMGRTPGLITDSYNNDSKQTFDKKSTKDCIDTLQNELTKLDSLEVVLAVVGTMKAGKSTTINAIVGTEVLPNRNRPMTALPTLIRHTVNQTTPILFFENNNPINQLMEDLHHTLKSSDGVKSIYDLDCNSDDMQELLKLINSNAKFKQRYQGAEEIFWLLKSLNDLVRLSAALNKDFPFSNYRNIHELPVIEVAFAHLAGVKEAKGSLTLLDTPGPNEDGQVHLRSMLQEQLKKASAVLAVLDFTQLKSDADAQVRAELKDISSITKDRLYVLVNKFDQRDRNGDNADQVKNFISENLMQKLIGADSVFPVSSRWAYLANRAHHEIEVHKDLPDYKQNPWVADFAEEALGKRWERRINDTEETLPAIQALWEDSLFEEPMSKIIQAAHAKAEILAIDSATSKILDTIEKTHNFLVTIETILLRDNIKGLDTEILRLNESIERIKKSQDSVKDNVEHMVTLVKKGFDSQLKSIKNNTRAELNAYFKSGKTQEIKTYQQEMQREEELKKQGSVPQLEKFRDLFVSSLLSQEKQKNGGKGDFDPNSPIIKFHQKEGEDGFDLFKSKINKSISKIIEAAGAEIRANIDQLLVSVNKELTNNVTKNAESIVSEIRNGLDSAGFAAVRIHLPDAKIISLQHSSADILDAVNEKSEDVTRHRRKSGVWGTVCKWFGTSDWGWESYTEKRSYYEINIKEIERSTISSIEKNFDHLQKNIAENIEAPLKENINIFYHDFRLKAENIRGDINKGVQLKERTQEELRLQLSELMSRGTSNSSVQLEIESSFVGHITALRKTSFYALKDAEALKQDSKAWLAKV